jgi:hypothetical protein
MRPPDQNASRKLDPQLQENQGTIFARARRKPAPFAATARHPQEQHRRVYAMMPEIELAQHVAAPQTGVGVHEDHRRRD